MDFTSFEYYLYFLPIVIILVFSVSFSKKPLQIAILLFSSWLFFWFASGWHLILLLISTVVDWNAGKIIHSSRSSSKKHQILILSLVANLTLLGTFKYLDFFIETFNYLSFILGNFSNYDSIGIALPVGISFYTFQTMSYTIDIYRKKAEPMDSFLDFACYAAFFPQLVAGPIVRNSHFRAQIAKSLKFSPKNIKIGLTLIFYGLFKKLVIADNMAVQVNHIFSPENETTNFFIVWLGSFLFGIQIYTDFSAYSEIAIGSSKLFGIDLPENFKHPYFATSPQDFWKRWHISLSTWLRDYLYIPLGGSHNGIRVLIFSTMATMLLGGLWHGSSWNFVLWGFVHGLAIVIHKYSSKNIFFEKINKFNKTFSSILSLLIMQIFIIWTLLFFRIQDFVLLKKYVLISIGIDASFELNINDYFTSNYALHFIMVILFVIFHFISYKLGGLNIYISRLNPIPWGITCGVILSLTILFDAKEPTDFIYFRF